LYSFCVLCVYVCVSVYLVFASPRRLISKMMMMMMMMMMTIPCRYSPCLSHNTHMHKVPQTKYKCCTDSTAQLTTNNKTESERMATSHHDRYTRHDWPSDRTTTRTTAEFHLSDSA